MLNIYTLLLWRQYNTAWLLQKGCSSVNTWLVAIFIVFHMERVGFSTLYNLWHNVANLSVEKGLKCVNSRCFKYHHIDKWMINMGICIVHVSAGYCDILQTFNQFVLIAVQIKTQYKYIFACWCFFFFSVHFLCITNESETRITTWIVRYIFLLSFHFVGVVNFSSKYLNNIWATHVVYICLTSWS